MSAPTPPRLSEHLCFNLYSTSLKMTQLYKPMLAELKLTYPQYLVMVVLWEQEGLGIGELAARLDQDPGSITPVVKRLEAEGYLVRNRDPRDERNRIVTLTDKGKDLRAAGVEVSKNIASACKLKLSEVHQVMEILTKLGRNLDL
jgi:DNA-binding MarR family transcriptional regulator